MAKCIIEPLTNAGLEIRIPATTWTCPDSPMSLSYERPLSSIDCMRGFY
jgi:hypothetical protein